MRIDEFYEQLKRSIDSKNKNKPIMGIIKDKGKAMTFNGFFKSVGNGEQFYTFKVLYNTKGKLTSEELLKLIEPYAKDILLKQYKVYNDISQQYKASSLYKFKNCIVIEFERS